MTHSLQTRWHGALAVSLALHGGLAIAFAPWRSVAPQPAAAQPLQVRVMHGAVVEAAATAAGGSPAVAFGASAGGTPSTELLPRAERPLTTPPAPRPAAVATAETDGALPTPQPPLPTQLPGDAAAGVVPAGSQSAARRRQQEPSDATAPAATPVAKAKPVAEAASVTSPPAALAPAPAYLFGSRLDPGPQPLHDIEPVFPAEAGQQEGTVVLRLLIGESGSVDDVAVVRSEPKGVFESAALAAFGAARFAPGRVLGVAVKSQITIEVSFTPVNRGATVTGRSY